MNLSLFKRFFVCSMFTSLLIFLSLQGSRGEAIGQKAGARPLSMSAFSAVADDVNAVSWNPAGLSLIQNHELSIIYAPLYEWIKQSYLAYALPFGKWGTLAMDLSYVSYGEMDWRNEQGEKMGSFSRKDYSIYASYGITLLDSLSLGASVGANALRLEPIDDSATGIGIDIGALYNIGTMASVGLSIENVGGVNASDRMIARQKIRLGTAISAVNRSNMGLLFAFDVEEQQKRLDTLFAGVEWSIFSPSSFFVSRKLHERIIELGSKYNDMADLKEGLPEKQGRTSLYMRAGMKKRLFLDDPTSFSGGFCLKYEVIPNKMIIKFEHAFEWHQYLDTTHRLSMGLEFGKAIY